MPGGARSAAPSRVPAVKSGAAPAQPTDFDAMKELLDTYNKLQMSPLSMQDRPGVVDPDGNPIPGTGFNVVHMPARVDPATIEAAQRALARVQMISGATRTVIPSVWSERRGESDVLPENPVYEGVRSMATMPLQREQMEVEGKNAANQFMDANTLAQYAARHADIATARELVQAQAAAKVRASDVGRQEREFKQSQETLRRGQDLTLEGQKLRAGIQFKQIGAIADAGDNALNQYIDKLGYDPQTLQPNGKGNQLSNMYQDFGDRRIGTVAGKQTADIIGAASNHVGQVLEKRGLRGKQQDEILKSLQSGISDPGVGLKMALHYRDHIQKLRQEAPQLSGSGDEQPAADPIDDAMSQYGIK